MNIEQWGHREENEAVGSIVHAEPGVDHHSGKHLIALHGDAEAAIREAFLVDPNDKKAMLAKFRELSRNADTLGAAQLHNLYAEWEKD